VLDNADPVNHGAPGNEREDAHLGAAVRAPKRIDLENLPEQLGPAAPRRFRVEFDITRPVTAPPPPWGSK
jgi:hypothetical protein